MSGVVEIAALSALAIGYLDSKYHLKKDYDAASSFVKALGSFALASRRGKLNLWYVFAASVRSQPNALFLVYPEPREGVATGPGVALDDLFFVRRYTYKQTYDIVLKISAFLRKEYGISAGDSVALDFVNKPEYVFVWFALWQLGAIPAMINYNLSDRSLVHCISTAQAKLLVVDAEVRKNVEPVADQVGVPIVWADSNFFVHVINTYDRLKISDSERGAPIASDSSCLIFTSGTTGLPKAASMSWKKSFWGAQLYARLNQLGRNDVMYSAMPLYHSTAAVLGLMATLHMGGAYAIGHKFSTSTFWTQVKLTEATVIQYVGETCRYLLNAPPSPDETRHRVRQAMGNGLRPDVWVHFKERFHIPRINEFYGATEFPMAINNIQDGDFAIGGAGHFGDAVLALMRFTRFDIARVDQDTLELYRDPKTGYGVRAARNEPGEFLFKVSAKDIEADFQGYRGDEAATREKLAFDVFKKGDAWVRTGDLLKLDDDNSFHFVDRLGDTFRWKSENVSTNEVEEALSADSHIEQSVVVGVKVPNHEGRAGFAVIQLKRPDHIPDLEELGKMLIRRLPRYAVPIFIKFVPEISTTGNNKIQKKLFRDQKIPAPDIYWLQGTEYVPLTEEGWSKVERGEVQL